jgi:maltokinase
VTDSADAVRRVLGTGHDVVGAERQVSTDQANLSVAVDERWLVKWFREPIRRVELDVLERLTSNGFEHMPRFLGAIDAGDRVTAIVSELVVGATDGWQWYVDDVLSWIDGTMPLDWLILTADRMGRITAELHQALADPQPVFASIEPLRVQIAQRRAVALEQTTGDTAERLRARLGQIDAALARLPTTHDVAVQRVHGDLHAGQFLRSTDRLLLTDFDGDPMASDDDRIVLQPVERDLAALLQSLDHVGRVASRRRDGARVESFIAPAVVAAEDAYRRTQRVDDRLLFAFRVAQELHEYAYAATRLPVWGYVPDAAMTGLFPHEDPPDE